MLTSILTPVVDGSRGSLRRNSIGLAALFSLGTVLSSLATGLILTALAFQLRMFLTSRWVMWLATGIALLYLPRQMGWTDVPPLCQSTRQVPKRWSCDYPRWATALLFGCGLGSGFYTRISVPGFYLLVLWPFVQPGLVWPLLIWFCYGLVRSLSVWYAALRVRPNNFFSSLNQLLISVLRNASFVHRANAWLLVVVVAWLVARESLR
jgi:hypothetical protein